MSALNVRVAAATADTLGETPVWIEGRKHLYWVDLRRPAVRCLEATGEIRTWPMPELAGAIVARRSGGLVVALRTGLYAFDPELGTLELLTEVENGPPENRLNDAKCDVHGRLWVGSMWDYGAETSGSLYRVDPDRRITRVRSDVRVPNAIAFGPDYRTIYFADTAHGFIERADFEPETGAIGAWSLFAAADAAPGRPDGAAVDSEGNLWNARYQGGCVTCFAPDGRVVRTVPLPVTQPTSCAFGGPGLRTLFITTARQKLSAEELRREPLAGSVLSVNVDVPGLPEPAFAG